MPSLPEPDARPPILFGEVTARDERIAIIHAELGL
jgi:hypothetical protein